MSTDRLQPLAVPESVQALERLLDRGAEDLRDADIAYVNLLCAVGLPGAEGLDLSGCLATLAGWSGRVKYETDRHLYRFRGAPDEFNRSEGYFRMLMLVTVLQQDFKVRYNPDRIGGIDFRNSRDLFIHGLLQEPYTGTCASMPVLYVAVGRHLGYPLKLVLTHGHVFARWESADGRERFNIECASQGMLSFDDDYYKTWPALLTEKQVRQGRYLLSLTSAEEAAVFVESRGHCLLDNGRVKESRMAYEQACRLDPLRPGYRCWLRAAASTDSTTLSLSAARYRNYHPTLGRWIERDPEGYVDGMSLYQYCRSNPAGMTDPTGLEGDENAWADFEAWMAEEDYGSSGSQGTPAAASGPVNLPGFNDKISLTIDPNMRGGNSPGAPVAPSDLQTPTVNIDPNTQPDTIAPAVHAAPTDWRDPTLNINPSIRTRRGPFRPQPMEWLDALRLWDLKSLATGFLYDVSGRGVSFYQNMSARTDFERCVQWWGTFTMGVINNVAGSLYGGSIVGGIKGFVQTVEGELWRGQGTGDALLNATAKHAPGLNIGLAGVELYTGQEQYGAQHGRSLGWDEMASRGLSIASYITGVGAAYKAMTSAPPSGTFSSMMEPAEAARYQQYWHGLTESAPIQAQPYEIIPRYTPNGLIESYTTYDKIGYRAYQYEVSPLVRHGPGYHVYDQTPPLGSLGNGPRGPHISFD